MSKRERSTVLDPVKVRARAFEKSGIVTLHAFQSSLDRYMQGASGSTPANAWFGKRLDKNRAIIVANFLGLSHYDSLLHDTYDVMENRQSRELNKPKQIFLCYVKEDVGYARRLFSYLASHEYSIWFDEEAILAGQVWDVEIRKAVRSCQVILVVLSQNMSLHKQKMQKEVEVAFATMEERSCEKKHVIPILIEDIDIPPQFEGYQTFNAATDRLDFLSDLIENDV